MRRLKPLMSALVCLCIFAHVARADNWFPLDPDNEALWYNFTTVDWGSEDNDFVFFQIYRGGKSEESIMTQGASTIRFDCDTEKFAILNPISNEWEPSERFRTDGPVGQLGFDVCFLWSFGR
jgi:hypothetical protein